MGKAVSEDEEIQVKTRIEEYVDKEKGTDTRVHFSYVRPKNYDFVTTNFSYTFEHNGKAETYYGKGVVIFPKKGLLAISGGFEKLKSVENEA